MCTCILQTSEEIFQILNKIIERQYHISQQFPTSCEKIVSDLLNKRIIEQLKFALHELQTTQDYIREIHNLEDKICYLREHYDSTYHEKQGSESPEVKTDKKCELQVIIPNTPDPDPHVFFIQEAYGEEDFLESIQHLTR